MLYPTNKNDTGELTGKNMLEGSPLLINIRGCGYPPGVNCDAFADKYYNLGLVGCVQGGVVWK